MVGGRTPSLPINSGFGAPLFLSFSAFGTLASLSPSRLMSVKPDCRRTKNQTICLFWSFSPLQTVPVLQSGELPASVACLSTPALPLCSLAYIVFVCWVRRHMQLRSLFIRKLHWFGLTSRSLLIVGDGSLGLVWWVPSSFREILRIKGN